MDQRGGEVPWHRTGYFPNRLLLLLSMLTKRTVLTWMEEIPPLLEADIRRPCKKCTKSSKEVCKKVMDTPTKWVSVSFLHKRGPGGATAPLQLLAALRDKCAG